MQQRKLAYRANLAYLLGVDLVFFAAVMSALIFVHELGHFVWAKIFGVKVLMFSIGFGPKLLRLRGRETEYCIGLLPLGGFVKMLEENRQEPVFPEDQHRTFDAQPLWKRIIIVLAGPAMNLLFPVVLYVGVFANDAEYSPPTVGVVLPGHAAAGKLLSGDRILEINGERVSTFVEVQYVVQKNPEQPLLFKIFRNNEHVDITITPDEQLVHKPLGIVETIGAIGIGPHSPAPVIGIASQRSPAYRAGLRSFDLITEVRGQPVKTLSELEAKIAQNRGGTVPVTYMRPVRVPNALGKLGSFYVYESGLVALTPDPSPSDMTTRTGMEFAELYIAQLEKDSSEWRAGLRLGDRLLTIDGSVLDSWSMFVEKMRSVPVKPHRITWLRAGETHESMIEPTTHKLVNEYGIASMHPIVAARNWSPNVPQQYEGRPSLNGYVLPRAIDETLSVIHFIGLGLWKIARGELSLSTLGGPVTVYDVVMEERQKGPSYLLWAMAVISINLGLINLLPIPVLDGGHLLFFGAEAIGRRPLSLRIREMASLFGFIILVVLVGLALRNDIAKRWDLVNTHAEAVLE